MSNESILAYIEGRMPADEKFLFEQEMKASKQLQKEVNDLQFIYGISKEMSKQRSFNASAAWKKTKKRICRKQYRIWGTHLLRYAAAILFLPLLMVATYFYYQSDKLGKLTVGQVEQYCAYGLITKITLPDSSVVWMNSGTKISYPKQFIGKKRKVKLDGEAYFKVASDKTHRFDVETANGLTVSAYGTEFNVKSYADEDEIETTLAKGAVEISTTTTINPHVLHPGEQANFDKQSGRMVVSDANVYMNTAWKNGKLVFRRTMMKDVASKLSRRFNVHIILKDKALQDYTYSATFVNETIEEIMRLLEKTSPIKYTILSPEQESDYTFSPKTIILENK